MVAKKNKTFFGVAEITDDDSSALDALFSINLTVSRGHEYLLDLLVLICVTFLQT